jgi:peptide deformylase
VILDIVKWGNQVLVRPTELVTVFDSELQDLVKNMFETMYAAPGVGLAATQVGIGKRLFVMDCTSGKNPARKFAVINPKIESSDGEQDGSEGCLSVPGYPFDIARPEHVVVRAQDAQGDPLVLDVTGFEARCVCHEIDHLDGKLLLSRVSALKREMAIRKIKKQIKNGEW